jgi:hypothetical protein
MTLICRFPAPYIKPCARYDPNLSECAVKHGNEAIPQLAKGKFNKSWVWRGLWGGGRSLVLRKTVLFVMVTEHKIQTKEVGDAY